MIATSVPARAVVTTMLPVANKTTPTESEKDPIFSVLMRVSSTPPEPSASFVP